MKLSTRVTLFAYRAACVALALILPATLTYDAASRVGSPRQIRAGAVWDPVDVASVGLAGLAMALLAFIGGRAFGRSRLLAEDPPDGRDAGIREAFEAAREPRAEVRKGTPDGTVAGAADAGRSPLRPFPVRLQGGYTAVPYDAVTINGMIMWGLVDGAAHDRGVALVDPLGKVVMGESGSRAYRYATVEAAEEDAEVLRRFAEGR